MIIAIDGPAASGKGTLSKGVASALGLPCLDTGLLYRAVAHAVVSQGRPFDDASAAERAALALELERLPPDPELRTSELDEGASIVSAHPGVRRALLDAQITFSRKPGGAVLDGRDIGTTICPDADVKVFVTADPEIRARRRHADLSRISPDIPFEFVMRDIRRRDERDSSRGTSPLKRAPDATVIDTGTMGPADCLAAVLDLVRAKA